MTTLLLVRGNLSRSIWAIIASLGLVLTGLNVLTPTRSEASVISVPDETIGINLKYREGVDSEAAVPESIRLINQVAPLVEVTKTFAVGLGWYSIGFSSTPTDADAKLIAQTLRGQSTVENTSFDFKVHTAGLTLPVHTLTYTSSSYVPNYRYLRAVNSYDPANPSDGRISVRWKRPSRSPSAYTLAYASSTSGPWTSISVSSRRTYPSVSINGLAPGITYYFKVRAKYTTTRYSAYSSGVVTAVPIVKPQAVKLITGASVTASTSLSASWFPLQNVTERGGDSIVSYRLDVFKTSDNSRVSSCNPTHTTSCSVSGLPQGDYYGKVATINSVAETSTSGDSADFAYLKLWYLTGTNGINVEPAWAATQGGDNTVTVAVIDTGFTNAPILKANSWWNSTGNHFYGFDMLQNSSDSPSNDGDGPDNDPTDPGDYIANKRSSWHGTQVASVLAGWTTVGAAAASSAVVDSNSLLGVAPRVKLLPIRALGPTGGSASEVAAAINWASGFQVSNFPLNLHPAKVINLSMGTSLAQGCDALTQDAVTKAKNAGVILVTAAGNYGGSPNFLRAVDSYPGNCAGTINVGATGKSGDRTFYSNLGTNNGTYSGIDISAPGGDSSDGGTNGNCNQVSCITTTVNNGTTSATGEWSLASNQGTSFASPIVAGVVALMVSIDQNLTIDEAETILASASTKFAAGTTCARLSSGPYFECGEGIVNAQAAVQAVMPQPVP